ncbi:hypothetical protein N7490_008344 [Penicillium lividum]|nr:hypothetical protein N7490_008344 [Penicillium lividum]
MIGDRTPELPNWETALRTAEYLSVRDILVIGAGIAGLCAAIALGKQGHKDTILEKWEFLRETGAAIHLPRIVPQLLRSMGIDSTEFGKR